jgi:hypothetical protein
MNQFAVHNKFSRSRHLLKILPFNNSAFNLSSKGLLTGPEGSWKGVARIPLVRIAMTSTTGDVLVEVPRR